jgi:hypothetical protein
MDPYPHASLRPLRGLDKVSGTRLVRISYPACGVPAARHSALAEHGCADVPEPPLL